MLHFAFLFRVREIGSLSLGFQAGISGQIKGEKVQNNEHRHNFSKFTGQNQEFGQLEKKWIERQDWSSEFSPAF